MASGRRIDCYFDIASFFSYAAFVRLLNDLDKLAAHGVEVEFHPVFLAVIMQQSGNQPPWRLAAKNDYLALDSARAARSMGLTDWTAPKDLASMPRTLSSLRALHYIKSNYPLQVYLSTIHSLFHRHWVPPHANHADDDVLAAVLGQVTELPTAGRRLFSDADVRRIMEGRESMKDVLKKETNTALSLGAFGAPWFWVTDDGGRSEAFFGSDRFGSIYRHLGVGHHDVELLWPEQAKL